MKRYILFITVFLLSTLGYLISLNQPWIEGLYFFIYLISSLLFVFELGRLPDKELLKYPEAVVYRAKRVNYYTYIVLSSLVIQAILYSILSITFKLNTGLITFILWILSIVVIYIASIVNEKFNYNADVLDYVFQDATEPIENLQELLLEFDKGKDNLEKIVKRYPQLSKNFLYESYKRYESLNASSKSINYKELQEVKKIRNF